MRLRALLLAALLLGALAPTAWAEQGHGRQGDSRHVARAADASFSVRLVSDANVAVIPPGGSSQAAVVCASVPAEWARPVTGSRWISTQADCTASFPANADYQYSTSFTLPADVSPVVISGWLLSDDGVTVKLNGNTLFSNGSFRQAQWFAVSNPGGLQAGTNTLTFTVHNVVGPTGLDFRIDVRAGSGATALPGEATNHGQCVSGYAHERDDEQGNGHGQMVSTAARFYCWGDEPD